MDRNSVIDYVERLRTKPEHVRRRIALGTTAGITGVVAVAWLFAFIFSGTLSLGSGNTNTSTLAASSDTSNTTQNQTGLSQLLGAVGLSGASTAPAALTPVVTTTTTPSTDDAQQTPTGGDQTVIPF